MKYLKSEVMEPMENKNLSPNKFFEANSTNDSIDIKPIILQRYQSFSSDDDTNDSKMVSSSTKKWFPGANRKSAFQPYKQVCTVLTNLQRGNTQAETPIVQDTDVSFHTKAGQGEITLEDVKNESHVDTTDNSGLTALHWASAYGQLMSVQLLIENGAKIDNEGVDGETPLLLAASGGHHEVVRLLLTEGANPNHVDHVGNTALMYAAYGNHPHCCNELLLRGADVTVTNMNDDTAFSLACDNNSNLAQAVIENCLLTLLSPIS